MAPTSKRSEPPKRSDERDKNLTAREIEVLKLLAEDFSSKQIADSLGIATKTVTYHRQSIKKRLKVKGTAGIVRYAIREGIIEP